MGYTTETKGKRKDLNNLVWQSTEEESWFREHRCHCWRTSSSSQDLWTTSEGYLDVREGIPAEILAILSEIIDYYPRISLSESAFHLQMPFHPGYCAYPQQ
ncbi:hypothetical protein CDAR_96951 [Caerostris darwini]|uniref:Uncharacterized protein n=1 Tax=Caerostris darwini TaxID=1538125 RepID=A0AAV4T6Y7_9ARAC|nr:hypothetical protein CDAR_96951 [Caerostris darwini]